MDKWLQRGDPIVGKAPEMKRGNSRLEKVGQGWIKFGCALGNAVNKCVAAG